MPGPGSRAGRIAALPRERLAPNEVQGNTLPGEFRPRDQQPVRNLPGTNMAVVANPETGGLERDARVLEGNPQLVQNTPPSALDRAISMGARAISAVMPSQVPSLVAPPRPTPGSAPQTAAVPPDPRDAERAQILTQADAMPNNQALRNLLSALDSGAMTTVQATDAASQLPVEQQRLIDAYLRTIPPPAPAQPPPEHHEGNVTIQRHPDGSYSVIGPGLEPRPDGSVVRETSTLERLLHLFGGN